MTTVPLRSLSLAALIALAPLASAGTLFVDANLVSGANDGSSWADAFQGSGGLQSALAVAVSGDDVFVADGEYLPTSTGSRTVAFALQNGVALYGSFAGGEAGPEDRPPFGSADSVLTGDLNGDDGATQFGDNSFHLITTTGTNASAVIDGFVVTSGNANSGAANRDRGAGIICLGAVSPTIRNCRFIANRCTFGGGAGYINNGGAPSFTDCTFEDGIGGSFGGAFDIAVGGAVRFERCLFRGNTAVRAGALELFSSNGPVMNNCVFVDNIATGSTGGGAIWIGSGGNSTVRNCTITANMATASFAGGIRNQGVAGFRVLNSILYGNSGQTGGQGPASQANSSTIVLYSLVQGGFAGTGNVNGDPQFADAPNLDFTPGATSVAIDSGDNTEILPGTTLDFLHRPRTIDVPGVADTGVGPSPVVDMGAFEFPPASPWVDLGGSLAGASGAPDLTMSGPLTPLSANLATLSNAAPSALSVVFAGFSLANAPVLGGVLLPAPDVVRLFNTSAAGTLSLPFTWPAGLPSDLDTYYQIWVPDAGAPFGYAASNGMQGTTP
jgi:hypothetical protein